MSQSKPWIPAAIALVVGAAIGAFAVEAWRPARAEEAFPVGIPVLPPTFAETDVPARVPNPKPAGTEAPVSEPVNRRSEEEPDVLFTDALLEYAREGIVEGWRSKRSDEPTDEQLERGVEAFRRGVLAIPAVIGAELADTQSELELAREDARTGGVFEALRRVRENGTGPLPELVLDRDTFDGFFVTESPRTAVDGPTAFARGALKRDEPVPDGSVVSFPAGVHRLEDFGSKWREHYPRDLVLRGAGMNATLLVLDSDLSAYDLVRNLAIEDLSLHTDDDYLFDVREPAMSVTLRRVRFTGWDMGAGSSCLFGTESLALRAIDCEFLGGYGSSPRSGQLFDVRHNGLLARFEGCRIERTRVFGNFGSGATVVFVGCVIEDALDRRDPPSNVVLDRTPISYWNEETGSELARDLNDLFPDWRRTLSGF